MKAPKYWIRNTFREGATKTILHNNLRETLDYILLLTMALSVILFGSTSIAPLLLGVIVTSVIGITTALSFDIPPGRRTYIRVPLLILCGCGAIALVQNYLTPSFAHKKTTDILSQSLPLDFNISRNDITIAAMGAVYPLLAFATSLTICRDRARAEVWIKLLGLFGSFVAALGLCQFVVSPHTILFVAKRFYLDSVTGVFINRNSAATFFGLVILVIFHVAWQHMITIRKISMRAGQQYAGHGHIRMMVFYVVLLTITVTSLMLTKSRGGIGATMLGCCILVPGLILEYLKQFASRQKFWRRAIVAFAVTIGLFLILVPAAARVLSRVSVQGLDDARFCIAPAIFSASREEWISGHGLGSFSSVFPQYRDAACGIEGVWNRAHDLFLEGFFDAGISFILFASLAVGTLVWIFAKAIVVGRTRRSFGVLGMACLMLVVVHSTVDFSLQVPGIAFFAALLFAALTIVCTERNGRSISASKREDFHISDSSTPFIVAADIRFNDKEVGKQGWMRASQTGALPQSNKPKINL